MTEARRSADAAEQTARIEVDRRADEIATAQTNAVRFELVRGQQSAYYDLYNRGTEDAFDVVVSARGTDDRHRLGTLEPNDRRRVGPITTADDFVTVTWRGGPDGLGWPDSKRLYF